MVYVIVYIACYSYYLGWSWWSSGKGIYYGEKSRSSNVRDMPMCLLLSSF